MCDPLTIAVAAGTLGVAQQFSAYQGQMGQAKAAQTAANQQYANESNAIAAQAGQVNDQQAENAMDTAILGAREEGRIVASAADRGVGGSSLVQGLNASMFGIGRNSALEAKNSNAQRQQLAVNLEGADITRQSRIRQAPKPKTAQLILGIGQGVMGGFSTYAGMGGKLPGGNTASTS